VRAHVRKRGTKWALVLDDHAVREQPTVAQAVPDDHVQPRARPRRVPDRGRRQVPLGRGGRRPPHRLDNELDHRL